ncbi:MAG TPA: DedA family protein [Stellaceae bacterium]|nr:DedA family protein [Stellaceae bacterium]
MDVERFILDHGSWTYLITFVWTFFEGETFVLLAAFAAAQGMLFAPYLLVAAWLGSFAGDQCYFWLGRRFGHRLMERHPEWRPRVNMALGWLNRFDTIFILIFRFIYGVRNFSSFALGVSRIDWRRFLVLNLIAALLWAGTFTVIGFACGQALERMLGHLAHQISIVLLGGFIVLCAGGHVMHKVRRRRQLPQAAPTRM